MTAGLSYDAVTHTDVHAHSWDRRPDGYRRFERSVVIGHGPDGWAAAAAVLEWGVKTRSGFDVLPTTSSGDDGSVGVAGVVGVVVGRDYTLVARIGPVRLREPVRVVDVVDRADVRGSPTAPARGTPSPARRRSSSTATPTAPSGSPSAR